MRRQIGVWDYSLILLCQIVETIMKSEQAKELRHAFGHFATGVTVVTTMGCDKTTGAKPGNQLDSIFCEGAGLGIHILFNCDTYGNLGRFLSRKAQQECELRVLFQMSANDSAALTDSPKASTLGLNRGLFYNGQEGHLEIFHPYSLPAASWFEGAAKQLS